MIIQATGIFEELVQACQRLIPQLTSNNPPPTRQELACILSEGTSVLFLPGNKTLGLVRSLLFFPNTFLNTPPPAAPHGLGVPYHDTESPGRYVHPWQSLLLPHHRGCNFSQGKWYWGS